MKRVRPIFIFSVIWFLVGLFICMQWAERPVAWSEDFHLSVTHINGSDDYASIPTIKDAQATFPIHLAPFRNSNIKHHTEQIEGEETAQPPAFDPSEWAFRECCYRAIAGYTFWLGCGFFMNWFLGTIIRGKNTWMG
jgi:hypothetical protein